jgi:anti-repressor protein
MNNLMSFSNDEFGDVRVLQIEGEPWFVGKDIAEKLGYAKPQNAIATHVDIEDKKDVPTQGDLGGTQEMTIINESGYT